MRRFVLVDHTTDLTPAAMRPKSVLQDFIDAWFEQLNGPFGEEYGVRLTSFRIAKNPIDRLPEEMGINFRDTIPEAPSALAYHQVVNGVPDIEIGVDLFTSLTGADNDSVSSGGSHELLELEKDLGGNGWKDRQDTSGLMDAEEACDFVQNTGYKSKNGLYVSNFVLESFFIPGSKGPWDFMGLMKTQYDYSHGYGILKRNIGAESQVMGQKAHEIITVGTMTDLQKKRKAHSYSRHSRRMGK